MGNTARLDYLAPYTILDVSDSGTLLKNTSGGWLRDDRQLMERVAKVAWTWYRDVRQALSIVVSHISTEIDIGQLITDISGSSFNTMVTYITTDFVSQTTSINTDFAEVDPVGMFI